MKSSKLCGIAAALLLAATGASAADAVNPYVHSSSGQVVKKHGSLLAYRLLDSGSRRSHGY